MQIQITMDDAATLVAHLYINRAEPSISASRREKILPYVKRNVLAISYTVGSLLTATVLATTAVAALFFSTISMGWCLVGAVGFGLRFAAEAELTKPIPQTPLRALVATFFGGGHQRSHSVSVFGHELWWDTVPIPD
jgi:hypothetical protein